MSDGIARFKDFTGDDEPPKFQIRAEVFTCLDDIPIKRIGELSKLSEGGVEGMDGKVLRLFEGLLEPESYDRFKSSMEAGTPVVIGIKRIKELIPWLLEQYGLRPTEASSGSGTTSSESGASSTDGAPLMELTS